MKKFILLTLVMSMLFTAVSCGKKDEIKEETAPDIQGGDVTGGNVKTEITVGMPGFNQLISPYISSFNQQSDDVELKIIDYSKLVSEDSDGSKAVNKLKMDIISGEAPDIIAVYTGYMAEFVQKDMFADMYELMDEYGEVKREDFLPNVLKGFEVNGKIPAIAPNFDLSTAAVKTKFVGEDAENWTLDDVVAAYNSLPEDMALFGDSNSNRQEVSSYVFEKLSKDCVDFANYTCDFSNPQFAKALEFAAGFPQDVVYDNDFTEMEQSEIDAYLSEQAYMFVNDKALIKRVYIDGFGQALGNSVYVEFGGEPITFVGYPSSDGNGAETSCRWLYAITESSENKEAAWQFIEYMLTDDNFQNKMYESTGGIPVIRSVIDKQLANRDAEDFHTIWYSGITEEAVQQVYDYVMGVEFTPYKSYVIDEMISEETAAVLAHEKTGEECAEILQSRIEIYLSEKQ